MGWLSFIVIFSISLWLVWRYFGAVNLFKRELVLGFTIKVGFAIVYLLLSTYYFSDGHLTGDTARFFTEGHIVNRIFSESPADFCRLMLGLPMASDQAITILNQTDLWAPGTSIEFINDNKLILKINAVIHFISFGNVYVHGLVFSILSFIGIYFTYRTFEPWIQQKKLFWWCIIAFPNLAFWGTGLLKESLFIFGFGLWCWAIFKLVQKQYIYLIPAAIAGTFLLFNKPYAGAVIIGFTGLFLMGYLFAWSKKGLITISVLYLLLLGSAIAIPGKFNLTARLSAKQFDFDNLARGGIAFTNDSAFCVFSHSDLDQFTVLKDSIQAMGTVKGEYKLFGTDVYQSFTISPSAKKYPIYLIYAPSGSYIQPTLITNSPIQLVKNTVPALLNVFVRPLPTDGGDGLKILSFISNIALLALLIFAFIRRKVLTPINRFMVVGLLGSAITIALIIGWSVPVFGAIVRYKIPVELLLIIVSFIILKPRKHVKV